MFGKRLPVAVLRHFVVGRQHERVDEVSAERARDVLRIGSARDGAPTLRP